ncbi:MAG: sulfide-dependent adenosine diphosphate thiazole synthase [Candidatus Omnitrophica bacterium]|nr:sulfide-dependent adenosine diphosphate thiazole synthase [Candidatus Omnitrophota bacterium]MCM8831303.1 sulfide-dependent adenosine diphosphate thiazole synthase [Candidatus Omnitrophota bacterium]
MGLDEIKISEAIISSYTSKLTNSLELDAAIVGAGPSGLCCGYYLAKNNLNVAIFERKLSVGGGMWGGGMMFNKIVVQKDAKKILDEFEIQTTIYQKDYYIADSVEAVSGLCFKAIKAKVKIFNLLSAEDVLVKKGVVCGVVLNWTAVDMAGLHVDPLTVKAKIVVDATGHPAEIARIVEKKSGLKLNTPSGKIEGEKSMWADVAEDFVVKNSKEVCPGLFVCGMSANAVFGGPRMGPIFGGMLLSAKKVAEDIIRKLK